MWTRHKKAAEIEIEIVINFQWLPWKWYICSLMATFFAHYEVAVIFITNIHAIILINKMKKIFHLLQCSLGNNPWGRGLPYKNDQGALAIPFGC